MLTSQLLSSARVVLFGLNKSPRLDPWSKSCQALKQKRLMPKSIRLRNDGACQLWLRRRKLWELKLGFCCRPVHVQLNWS